MRPRHFAADNLDILGDYLGETRAASMRPRHFAADNSPFGRPHPAGHREAECERFPGFF